MTTAFSRDALWVVIPAYNEEPAISSTVLAVASEYPRVVVVDDGSSDDTAGRARDSGAIVVRHPINMGQGAALQTGIRFALRQNARLIATFDADGQHSVKDLSVLCETLERSNADVVLGSRFLGQAVGIPTMRRILLKVAVGFTRLTTGARVSDTHNGLRVMTSSAAEAIHITQNGMAHASEFIEQIMALRLRYIEAPVHISYTKYSLEKGQKSSHAVKVLGEIFTRWFEQW